MPAPVFHCLRVAEVEPLTEEAVAVTFAVPEHLAGEFAYLPGQHVTIRAEIDGRDVRRSYSICANANTGRLRVGVKKLEGGVFSTWANDQLTAGRILQVAPPTGEFIIKPNPGRARHYLAIAAGSGVTPVLSHLTTVLETEPDSRFTLVYGNRETRSVMFLEELQGCKDRFPDRFHLIHFLSREPQPAELFSGRIDPGRLRRLFSRVVDADSVDDWFLCGPQRMTADVRAFLRERGTAAEDIHCELFYDGEAVVAPPPPADTTGTARVEFTLDGRASAVAVDPDGPSILDHALAVRRELPFACKSGVCATCKAGVAEGEVRMDKNWALTAAEVERGLVLTCQAHPVTERVVLDYDV